MGRYKKILVAVDGSPSAENALRQSFRLAEGEKSFIRVVTAVPPFEGDLDLTGVPDVREALRRPGRAILERAGAVAAEAGAGISADLLEGDPWRAVIDAADCRNCGVIVMGRSGSSGLRRALIGSVTARVIGHSACDVLVFPAGSVLDWGSILVATDGSEASAGAVERAQDLALSYGGRLAALSVVDVPDEFYAQAPDMAEKMVVAAREQVGAIAARASSAGVPTVPMVREGNPVETILATVAERRVGLLVLGSHGRTGLGRVLMGSTAEKVLGSATCPVLVVKTVPAA